jgi:hypothetical protein
MLRPEDVLNIVQTSADRLAFYDEALDILDGRISPYIDILLQRQLSLQSYWQAKQRMSPINILPKIVDKLTNIYQTSVIRTTPNESDQMLVDYYVKQTAMNVQMNCANELYNSPCNAALIQPYVYKGKPCLRAIPNGTFVVYSDDPVQPNKPTHIILIYGTQNNRMFWVFSDEEIYATDGITIRYDVMAARGIESTVNEIGKIPFVYINSSKYKLVPTPDEDGLTLCKLIPLMLTDLNHASMFQCFSILYMINANDQALKYAPNAVWQMNANPATPDLKPEIGSIKPEVDYDQVLGLIEKQMAMWLGTKGIRPSSVGSLTSDNFASGISKVIDEMDTFEAREKQVATFQNAEKEYWSLISDHLHPYWTATKQIENVGLFSPNIEVSTTFAVQLPMQSRGQVVKDLKEEVSAGFTSRKRAISKLNPDLSSAKIDEMIREIDEEMNGETEEIDEETNGATEDIDTDTAGPETSTED